MTGPPTTPEPADAGPLAEQTDERSERADWRSTLVGAIAINVVAGLWLIVSPAPLDYESAANAIIWGAAILVINLVRLFAAPTSVSLAIVSAIAGGLTVISGVLFSEPPGELINLIVIGGAVVVLSLIALPPARRRRAARGLKLAPGKAAWRSVIVVTEARTCTCAPGNSRYTF